MKKIVVGIIAVFAVAACSSGSSHLSAATGAATSSAATASTAKPQVAKVNAALDSAARQVSTIANNVVTLVGAASTSPLRAAGNRVAQVAQVAHDELASLANSQVDAFTHSGVGGYQMYSAVAGLTNSMGALVAFLANVTPATRASFITQSDKAGSAWNAGVRLVYPQALGTKLLIG